MTESGTEIERVSTTTLGVLISGRGSNLRALCEAITEGRLSARIGVVISNVPDAPGLLWARDAGLATVVADHRAHPSRADYDRSLVAALRAHGVGFVCLAGFMRVLGSEFCAAFPNAVANVHPSLLPAFPGVDAQRQAFEHGVKVAGVTVHLVTPELDAGPIVAQAAVPVRDDDSVESLRARILVEEHRLFPEAVQRLLASSWKVDGRRVVFGTRES
jgi:phosphoribosylglycinamide formyltransferase-1